MAKVSVEIGADLAFPGGPTTWMAPWRYWRRGRPHLPPLPRPMVTDQFKEISLLESKILLVFYYSYYYVGLRQISFLFVTAVAAHFGSDHEFQLLPHHVQIIFPPK